MKGENIIVNGVPLNVIISDYDNLHLLLSHIKETNTPEQYEKIMSLWEKARKNKDYNITLELKEKIK